MVGLLCLPKTLWQKMHKRACFILLELAMKTLTRPQLLCFFEAKLKKYKPLPKTIGLSHFLEIYRLRSTSGGNSRIWSGKILYVAGQLKGGKHNRSAPAIELQVSGPSGTGAISKQVDEADATRTPARGLRLGVLGGWGHLCEGCVFCFS